MFSAVWNDPARNIHGRHRLPLDPGPLACPLDRYYGVSEVVMSECATKVKVFGWFVKTVTEHTWGKWSLYGHMKDFFGVHPVHKRTCLKCGITEIQ